MSNDRDGSDSERSSSFFEYDEEILEDFYQDEEDARYEIIELWSEGVTSIRHELQVHETIETLHIAMEIRRHLEEAKRNHTALSQAAAGPRDFLKRKQRREAANAAGVILPGVNAEGTFGNFLQASVIASRADWRGRRKKRGGTERSVVGVCIGATNEDTPIDPAAGGKEEEAEARDLEGHLSSSDVEQHTESTHCVESPVTLVLRDAHSPKSASVEKTRSDDGTTKGVGGGQRKVVPRSLADHLRLNTKAMSMVLSGSRGDLSLSRGSSSSCGGGGNSSASKEGKREERPPVFPQGKSENGQPPREASSRLLGRSNGNNNNDNNNSSSRARIGSSHSAKPSSLYMLPPVVEARAHRRPKYHYKGEKQWPDWRVWRESSRLKSGLVTSSALSTTRQPNNQLEESLGRNSAVAEVRDRAQWDSSSLSAVRPATAPPATEGHARLQAARSSTFVLPPPPRPRPVSAAWRCVSPTTDTTVLVTGNERMVCSSFSSSVPRPTSTSSSSKRFTPLMLTGGTFSDAFYNVAGGSPSVLRAAIEAQRAVSQRCANIVEDDPNGQRASSRGCVVRKMSGNGLFLASGSNDRNEAGMSGLNSPSKLLLPTSRGADTRPISPSVLVGKNAASVADVACQIRAESGLDPSLWSAAESRAVKDELASHSFAVFEGRMPKSSANLKRAADVYSRGPRTIRRYVPPSEYGVTTHTNQPRGPRSDRQSTSTPPRPPSAPTT